MPKVQHTISIKIIELEEAIARDRLNVTEEALAERQEKFLTDTNKSLPVAKSHLEELKTAETQEDLSTAMANANKKFKGEGELIWHIEKYPTYRI